MKLVDKYPANPNKVILDRYSTGSRKAGNWSHCVEYTDGSVSVWFVEKHFTVADYAKDHSRGGGQENERLDT